MTAEWLPDVPDRLSRAELRQYRRGRDAFVAKLAERLGGRALVIEATVGAAAETAAEARSRGRRHSNPTTA